MPTSRRTLRLICVCLCAVVVAACSGGDEASPTQTQIQQQASPTNTIPAVSQAALPTDEAGNAIVARVNNVNIMLTDYERIMQRYQAQQFLMGDAAAMRALVLGTLVEQELINQAAAQGNLSITEEELDAEIAANVEMAGGEEAWTNWLRDNMYSPEEYRATVRATLTTLKMRDIITAPLTQPIEQTHARHILVETEEIAAQLLTRLQNNEDFAALAGQYSADLTTRENGGDLGWFTREELLEPTLAELAFTIEPGTVVGPVQTILGYHILQTLEREVRPIEDSKRPILAQMYFDNWLQTRMISASIEYYLQN